MSGTRHCLDCSALMDHLDGEWTCLMCKYGQPRWQCGNCGEYNLGRDLSVPCAKCGDGESDCVERIEPTEVGEK